MSGFVECFLIFCITITAIIAIVYDKNIRFKNKKSPDAIEEISVTLEGNEEKKTKNRAKRQTYSSILPKKLSIALGQSNT